MILIKEFGDKNEKKKWKLVGDAGFRTQDLLHAKQTLYH